MERAAENTAKQPPSGNFATLPVKAIGSAGEVMTVTEGVWIRLSVIMTAPGASE